MNYSYKAYSELSSKLLNGKINTKYYLRNDTIINYSCNIEDVKYLKSFHCKYLIDISDKDFNTALDNIHNLNKIIECNNDTIIIRENDILKFIEFLDPIVKEYEIPDYTENTKEFINNGLLWFVNRTLHLFGYAIQVDIYPDGAQNIHVDKCSFRGFVKESETKGFTKVTKYLQENVNKLLKDCEE